MVFAGSELKSGIMPCLGLARSVMHERYILSMIVSPWVDQFKLTSLLVRW
jgi:hypothetical protein